MNIFELFGTIAIKNRDANEAIEDTAKKAERSGSRIQKAFKDIGNMTIRVGKVAMAGAAAMGTAWVSAVESTRDYRAAMAQLDTAFIVNGHSAETAKDTYKRLQAVLGDTDKAVEAASSMALMCDTTEDLNKWVEICTGVYAEMGEKLPIESLTEAANETSKTGQLTGGLADALNWAGINEEDFQKKLDACTTEEERQDLIMNTLYWTYKKASDQYKVTGEKVMEANEAQEKLNSAIAKLADIGEPIISGIKTWIADMVTAAVPHLETFIGKCGEIGTTWTTSIWPLVQKAFNVTLGIDLPDWQSFKSDLKTRWENIKTSVSEFFRLTPGVDTPETEGFISRVKTWWSGQGDNAYERVKSVLSWTLGTFIVPGLEAIDSWWNGEGGGEDKLLGLLSWTLGEFIVPAISDIVTSTGQTVAGWAKEFIDGVVMLLDWGLGELGLPTVTDVVKKINDWWTDVTSQLKLKYSALFEVNEKVISGRSNSGSWENPYVGHGEYDYGWGNDYSVDGSHAAGLDRVPRDGYISRLHKDEAVLTAAEASVWRGGGSGRVEALLAELVSLFRAGQMIQLDSGILAGQLTPAIDAQLGTITRYKGRGN